MNNIVTRETAQRLKNAGFPQPEPEVGQFWYDGMLQRLSIASNRIGIDQHLYLAPINAIDWAHYFESVVMLDDKNDWPIFAPTTTDILSAFADYELLSYATTDPQGFVDMILDVEEMAKIWLKLNEK